MTKFWRVVPWILFICNLLFIFGNSALDSSGSMTISTKAEIAIEKVVGKDIGDDSDDIGAYSEFNGFLRKFAHAVEFFTLGALWYICAQPFTLRVRCLSLGLVGVSVPLLDETIQLFSGRSSMVSDMWIDISGYAVGIIIALTAELIHNFVRKKRQGNE